MIGRITGRMYRVISVERIVHIIITGIICLFKQKTIAHRAIGKAQAHAKPVVFITSVETRSKDRTRSHIDGAVLELRPILLMPKPSHTQSHKRRDKPAIVLKTRPRKLPASVFHFINGVGPHFVFHHCIVTHNGVNNPCRIIDTDGVAHLADNSVAFGFPDFGTRIGEWGDSRIRLIDKLLVFSNHILFPDFLKTIARAFQQVSQYFFNGFV